jgi:hypothetical protein
VRRVESVYQHLILAPIAQRNTRYQRKADLSTPFSWVAERVHETGQLETGLTSLLPKIPTKPYAGKCTLRFAYRQIDELVTGRN